MIINLVIEEGRHILHFHTIGNFHKIPIGKFFNLISRLNLIPTSDNFSVELRLNGGNRHCWEHEEEVLFFSDGQHRRLEVSKFFKIKETDLCKITTLNELDEILEELHRRKKV